MSFFRALKRSLDLLDRLELKLVRDNWKRLKPPETVFLFVDVLRHQEFHDMTDRP